jgi:hypothetical protein
VDPTTPIPLRDFIKLVDRSAAMIRLDAELRQFAGWHRLPAARARELSNRGSGRPWTYVALDAVTLALADQIVAAGPRRKAVAMAMPGIVLALNTVVDDEDGVVAIGIGQESGTVVVVPGLSPISAVRRLARTGARTGVPFATGLLAPTWPAVAVVRARAEKHGVQLPDRFAMPGRPTWAGEIDESFEARSGGLRVEWGPAEYGSGPLIGPARLAAV